MTESTPPNNSIKIVLVGDGYTGKTCLAITYTQNKFPSAYTPTVFDKPTCVATVDGKEYNLAIWDTAGQEDYDRLRLLAYADADCILLCYAIDKRPSFKNILPKWYPELQQHCPKIPKILVGTKLDLQEEGPLEEFISTKEATELKEKINAYATVECSALKKTNLTDVFAEAVRAVEQGRSNSSSRCCSIL